MREGLARGKESITLLANLQTVIRSRLDDDNGIKVQEVYNLLGDVLFFQQVTINLVNLIVQQQLDTVELLLNNQID